MYHFLYDTILTVHASLLGRTRWVLRRGHIGIWHIFLCEPSPHCIDHLAKPVAAIE